MLLCSERRVVDATIKPVIQLLLRELERGTSPLGVGGRRGPAKVTLLTWPLEHKFHGSGPLLCPPREGRTAGPDYQTSCPHLQQGEGETSRAQPQLPGPFCS